MVTQQYSPRAAYRFSLFRQSGARRVQPCWEESEGELKEQYPELQSPDDPALDILALIELRQRAEAVFVNWHKDQFRSLPSDQDRQWFLEQVKALTTPAGFFTWTGTETKGPLYHPLPVIQRKAVGSETEIIEKASQLSAFLIQLQQEQSRQGVLITTRSGGGKTVACRQADLQFLGMQQRAADEQKRQPSSATIPVWISLQHATGFKQNMDQYLQEKSYQEQIIELLVANAYKEPATTDDELQSRQRTMLRQLFFGPSLVLFFDLNHVNELDRELYTEAIIAFQKHPRLGKKHRCVVVYRGAGKGDRVIQRLLSNTDRHWPGFQEYDLKTIKDEQAIEYCGQIREFEQRLWKDSENGLTNLINERFENQDSAFILCQPVLDGSEQQTRTLLQQLIRRSRMAKSYENDSNQTEEDNDSLISVPLLMHWVSLLEPQALSRIANLTHLYREIVSQHLIREHPQMDLRYKDLIDLKIYQTGEAKNSKPVIGKIVTAMTRIALAILAQGAGTTIAVDEACELLEDPSEYPEDDSGDWHLKSSKMPLLAKSDYNRHKFEPEEAQAILRHGLFRQEGDQLRFAHDSLIYYFAGMALREFKKPGKPGTGRILPETWAAAIADILLQNPGRWLLPVEFLGGAMLVPPENGKLKGQPSQALRELVMRLVAYWPDLPRDEAIAFMEPVPKLVSRLCSTQPQDRVLQQVYQATNDHSRFAWKHPHLLLQEVMNRCCWFGAPENEVEQWARQLDIFLDQEPSSRNTNRPEWLKKTLGSRFPDTLTIEGAHTGRINSVAVFEGPDGPRIVSAGVDKRIVISDLQTGEVKQVIADVHTDDINSVTVCKLSGGLQIVSVGNDGRIVISDPITGKIERTIEAAHADRINSVAVYEGANGPRIVSAGSNKRIVITDPQTETVERTIDDAHTDAIISVAVYVGPEGPRIVSAGSDKQIVITDPQTETVERTIDDAHTDAIISVAVYVGPEGPRIVSADWNRQIVISDPRTGTVERTIQDAHTRPIYSVTVYGDPEEPRIVSVGDDKRIVISDPRTGNVERTIKDGHTDNINCVAVYSDPDGPRIVSAGDDRRIVISDPRTGTVEPTIEGAHTKRIKSVAVYEGPDGPKIVSAGDDRRIVISDLWTGAVEQTIEGVHAGWINKAVVYSSPDCLKIISAGDDRRIVISDLWTGAVEQTIENAHTGWTSSVVVYTSQEGPRIVSVWGEKRIVISDLQVGTVERTIDSAHTHLINSMVVYASPDGPRIVSVGRDQCIVISDPRTGAIERTIKGVHRDWIKCVAVYSSPDGSWIVSAGWDQCIVISDPRTGAVERILDGAHTRSISSVTVYASPEGSRIISVGDDGKIKIWNMKEILSWSGDKLNRPEPISTLHVKAKCWAIDQANNRLICAMGNHIEVYEFVTN